MSKLFHTRRIRFTSRNDGVNDTHLDTSPPELNSHRRTSADRRHHHRNNRQDLGGCNPNSRRSHRHHLSEHDEVVNQPQSGSIINSEDFRSIRRWGATENDRLPGVVLLARERLVERLRGVHISQNRSSISYNDLPMSSMTKMLPRGLSRRELSSLEMTVFIEGSDESSSASRECSICLEGFEDGDEVMNLVCMHRFHSGCLFPWIEVCGACPNCRKDIVVTDKPGC